MEQNEPVSNPVLKGLVGILAIVIIGLIVYIVYPKPISKPTQTNNIQAPKSVSSNAEVPISSTPTSDLSSNLAPKPNPTSTPTTQPTSAPTTAKATKTWEGIVGKNKATDYSEVCDGYKISFNYFAEDGPVGSSTDENFPTAMHLGLTKTGQVDSHGLTISVGDSNNDNKSISSTSTGYQCINNNPDLSLDSVYTQNFRILPDITIVVGTPVKFTTKNGYEAISFMYGNNAVVSNATPNAIVKSGNKYIFVGASVGNQSELDLVVNSLKFE